MRLLIVSGLSGSGKTIALHALEDEGFYCVDNLHLSLVPAVARQLRDAKLKLYDHAAIGIDARSGVDQLEKFPAILNELKSYGFDVEVIFLQADPGVLLKRFNETRRVHPLGRRGMPLVEAIHLERSLLSHVSACADLVIDTNHTNVHQLTRLIRDRIQDGESQSLSLLFQSFGFKYGAPNDSDYVFDVRCLPNPHWEPQLRSQTGLDQEVKDYLSGEPYVEQMFDMVKQFVGLWVPRFEQENRNYVTVSIGCTGGQHRSVYLAQRLCEHFERERPDSVSVRHRELY